MCPFAVLTQPRRCNALIEVCMKLNWIAKQVIVFWVHRQLQIQDIAMKKFVEFSNVDIQTKVVEYGRREGSVWHIPDFYSREWRKIREDIRYGKDYGFTVEEFKKEGELIKWYRVTKS